MAPVPARRVRPFLPAALLVAVAAYVSAGPTASAQGTMALTTNTQLPAVGSQWTLSLAGTPGALFFIKLSATPAEFASNFGTIFLDPTVLLEVARGTLDATGSFSVTFTIPNDPTLVGSVFYFQAAAKAGTAKSSSNALAVRIGAGAPSGARQPAAIAATADGSRVYVAHEKDGTVTVLDPATNSIERELPISALPTNMERAPDVAVDPEGRHVFVVNPAVPQMTVIHAATESISAQIPVPLSCRAVAFKFDANGNRVFVASEKDDGVLVFTESPHGRFTQTAVLPLRGQGPAKLALLSDGHLLVGLDHSLEMEVIDPDDLDGDPFVTSIPLGSRPIALARLDDRVFVATFTPSTIVGPDGVNEVLEFDSTGWTLRDRHFGNLGTDYFALAASAANVVVCGQASGTAIVSEPTAFSFTSVIDMIPEESPKGLPAAVALVPPSGGGTPDRAWIVDRVRETIRAVDLASGPPFTLEAEIPLAHTGQPVHPLLDLNQNDRGEFLFSNVLFFNGTPALPNPVSCTTCHPGDFADSITSARGRQAPPMFATSLTAPFSWQGDAADLATFTKAAFARHGAVGGKLNKLAAADVTAFMSSLTRSPTSPFKNSDGSISDAAQRGELLFNGVASCSTCHTAPLFIPVAPAEPTIVNGVGTGLAPVNVPTLLGIWATAPYLHDGSARTLMDVLDNNVGDQHGTTSGLDAGQKSDLVEFLKTL
jgi:YVTN family beta-propeller protein